MKKQYQIFITDTSKSGQLRRFSLSIFQLRVLSGVFLFLLLCLCVFAFDYTIAVSKQAEVRRLRAENLELNRHIHVIKEKVKGLESDFQRVEDFSFKLKSIINRGSFPSETAIGPLPYGYQQQHYMDSAPEKQQELEDHQSNNSPASLKKKNNLIKSNKFFENYLSSLKKRSHFLQKDIWSVIGILDENRHLMDITPSIQPAKGRVTSRFGFRNYPISGFSRSMADFHRGLDIASKHGTEVIAPADAVVLLTGYDSSTGNYIILSHGYDLETLYGHLNNVKVKPSQKVKRGEVIGTVGSTGRSTGPHLHYEVRIAAQPVDPEHYILDFL